LHGLGHGAMLSSVILNRHVKYDACQPFKFHQAWAVEDVELDIALDACDFGFGIPEAAASCAGGVYHTYTSMYARLPLNISWRVPCNRTLRYSERCFEFTMQNYDVEDNAKYFRASNINTMIRPGECLHHPMQAEATIRGCIFMASHSWTLFFHNTKYDSDALCGKVAVSPYKLERWLLCWSASLRGDVRVQCNALRSAMPRARPYLSDICNSSTLASVFYRVYPARLLRALPPLT